MRYRIYTEDDIEQFAIEYHLCRNYEAVARKFNISDGRVVQRLLEKKENKSIVEGAGQKTKYYLSQQATKHINNQINGLKEIISLGIPIMAQMIKNAPNDVFTSLRDVTGAVKYASDIQINMLKIEHLERDIKLKERQIKLNEAIFEHTKDIHARPEIEADIYEDNFEKAMIDAIKLLSTSDLDEFIAADSLEPIEVVEGEE